MTNMNKVEMNDEMLEQVNGGGIMDLTLSVTSAVSKHVTGTDVTEVLDEETKEQVKSVGNDLLNSISDSLSSQINSFERSVLHLMTYGKSLLFR